MKHDACWIKVMLAVHAVFFWALLSGAAASSATFPAKEKVEEPAPLKPWFEPVLSLSAGLRSDNLDWNIASDTTGTSTPNILSELTWDDLKIFQLALAFESRFVRAANGQKVLFMRAKTSYGWIYDGNNQDSDYLGNDRTLEFSRSNNNADDGEVWDGSIGFGPRFTFGTSYLEMMPLIGYSYHAQRLTVTDGFQTLPPLGSFSGLDSSYDTEWYGPWAGLDFTLKAGQGLGVFENVVFFGSFEYHWADYYAEANWNLRDEFAHPKSFEHEADGHGYTVTMGARLFFNARWALTMAFGLSRWETDPGVDRVFYSDGGIAETRLNEVNWDSDTVSVGVACYF